MQHRLWRELSRRDPNDAYAFMMREGRRGGDSFVHLPYTADIMRDPHPMIVIQKSAQVGATEMLVFRALHAADSAYAGRGNVLFVMPTQNMMDDFAQARFDRVLQDSAYLRGRLQPEPPKRKGADRLRLKRIGDGHIYLRGAESTRQLASVDADLVIADEFDQMPEEVLEALRRRIASSREGQIILGSTPRYPEAGINALYLQSDRRRYYLPCLSCGLEQPLRWPENVDVERQLVVCRDCRRPMLVTAQGRWVAEAPGNAVVHGYHLNRLYSPWLDVGALIEASGATTLVELQRFQNEDLGEVFTPPGGGLSMNDLDACRGNYTFADYRGEPCVMGVDVGNFLHVVVRQLPEEQERWVRPRLWFAGAVADFAQLDVLYRQFNVQGCVIDERPETRKATEFAQSHERTFVARYDRRDPPHETEEGYPGIFHLNRTEAIDAAFDRFRNGQAELPRDARQLGGRVRDGQGDYYRQLLTPQRTVESDAAGNRTVRWFDNGKPDDFAHAEVYALFAERLGRRGSWRPLDLPDDISHRRRNPDVPFDLDYRRIF